MPVTRIFLPWSEPLLPQAARYLLQTFGERLRDVLAVVPGSRAGRRLLELLVKEAGGSILPPKIITAGHLPEELLAQRFAVIDPFTRRLIWTSVILSFSPEELAPLMPAPPVRADFVSWYRVAEHLDRLYTEIAGAALTFSGILTHSQFLGDESRWQVLAAIEEKFLASLKRRGLTEQHQLRLRSLERGDFCTSRPVVLIGLADLNLFTRKMLLSVERGDLCSLVHSSPSLCDAFDEFGCPLPAHWLTRQIDLNDKQMHMGQKPKDQARAAATLIAQQCSSREPAEMSVGAGDEKLLTLIGEELAARNIESHLSAGRPVLETSVLKFLNAAREFVSLKSFKSLATLLRHPEVLQMANEPAILRTLDLYQSKHFQGTIQGELPGAGEPVRKAVEMVESFLAPLSKRLPLRNWAGQIREVLKRLYAGRRFDRANLGDQESLEAIEAVSAILEQFEAVPEDVFEGALTGPQALSLLDSELRQTAVPPDPSAGGVELLGWLELALDDAPYLVLAGLNEGHIPESLNADPFLPNSLRTRLGLLDNDRRYVRDAFALTCLRATHPDLQVIIGFQDTAGNPLSPSRLLFACGDKDLASRVRRFYDDRRKYSQVSLATRRPAGKNSFVLPVPPKPATPKEGMSATEFGSYLLCPYRYYLRHVLHLECLDDRAEELDALAFGSLTHAVLSDFAASGEASSANPEGIFNFLKGALEARAMKEFGERALPAIYLQIEQIHGRLRRFADWQARRTDEGWKIEGRERPLKGEIELPGGIKFGVYGRIDRIDFNPGLKTWALLDYKTSERARDPRLCRKRSGEWTDLQLPIYRYLFGDRDEEIQLGYISLSAENHGNPLMLAEWNKQELEEAQREVIRVAAAVREGRFWPPSELAGAYDPYAVLCGTDQFTEDGL